MDTLAERLKFARKQAGLTQIQLSECVTISQGSLSDLENGRNKSSTNLIQIANILNVNPNWLATGEGDMELKVVFNGENNLAERLKFVRKKKNLTQMDVANAIGITQATYSELERGLVKSSGKIVELANLFGVSPTWLATGQGDMYQQNDTFAFQSTNSQITHYPSATITQKESTSLPFLFGQDNDLECCFTTLVIGDDMTPALGHLSTVMVDKRKVPLPIVNGMIYAVAYHDRILCRYLRQHLNNTIQIYSELDKQGDTLSTDEFFNHYQIMGGVIYHIQSHQWQ